MNMTENERLADELLLEFRRAEAKYVHDDWTAEQFLARLRIIIKAANLC
jgi:hypothetical protein